MDHTTAYYERMMMIANQVIEWGGQSKPILVAITQSDECYFYEMPASNAFADKADALVQRCHAAHTHSVSILKFRVCTLTDNADHSDATGAYFLQTVSLKNNGTIDNSTLACSLMHNQHKELRVKGLMGIDGNGFSLPCELSDNAMATFLTACTLATNTKSHH